MWVLINWCGLVAHSCSHASVYIMRARCGWPILLREYPFFLFFSLREAILLWMFFFSMGVGFSLAAQFSPDGNFSINTRFSTGVDSTVESMLGPVDL